MKLILPLTIIILALSACAEVELGSHLAKKMTFPSDDEERVGDFKVGNPYKIKGQTYYPQEEYEFSETGIASWYGPGFHGKLTANGERFNKHELTAAHKTLQLPSMVRVTNLDNGRAIIVRVNDRGPFSDDRIIDLSEKAASIIGMKSAGTARVRIDILEKESRQVAIAARSGRSTRGTEIALNRGKSLDARMPLLIAKPRSKPISQQRTYLASANLRNSEQFNSIVMSQANINQPTRKPMVLSPYNYFIETGRFVSEDDAMTTRLSLGNITEPVYIYSTQQNGSPLYYLKIGPYPTEASALNVTKSLNANGRPSKIVMVQK